jgi:hypothetical protein
MWFTIGADTLAGCSSMSYDRKRELLMLRCA